MANEVARPNFAPTVNNLYPIQVSVSSVASAIVGQVGPFRGFVAIVSSSFTVTDLNGKRAAFDNVPRATTLWIQGFLSTINASAATATSTNSGDAAIVFGVL